MISLIAEGIVLSPTTSQRDACAPEDMRLKEEKVTKPIDMTGARYGRLTVISRDSCDAFGNSAWLCQCDCGGKTVVRGANLRGGAIKSCGCLRSETSKRHIRKINRNKPSRTRRRIYEYSPAEDLPETW